MNKYTLRHTTVNTHNPSSKSFRSFFQPALAWAYILGLSLVTALLLAARLGKFLNYIFPAGALTVGVFLYFKYPILYNGFVWWTWLITPLIRRLADYRGGGFTDPSPILLAPYLVTFISIITVWKTLPRINRLGGMPFVLTFVSITYGFLVGLINRNPIQVGIGLLDWLSPVLLGFHLFLNWKNYISYRQNTQRVFFWGVIVLGIYGIFQYIFLPEWDKFWMINAEITSIGQPQPMSFRIWSTLNSGEPFAAWMAAALLLILSNTTTIQLPATIAGYLSFLLAMVRSAWLGWMIGLLILWNSLKSNLQIRLLAILLVLVIMIILLLTIAPFSDAVLDRLSTFSNLEEDNSAAARQETYRELLGSALNSYLGEGLGGAKHDSTVLAMLLSLGVFGTLFYLTGLFLLLFSLFQNSDSHFDPFVATSRAIAVSVLVRIPLNTALLGISGMLIWGFVALSLGAKKYYRYRPTELE